MAGYPIMEKSLNGIIRKDFFYFLNRKYHGYFS